MGLLIVILIVGSCAFYYGLYFGKKVNPVNPIREHERNHYYELVLSAIEDVKPRTFVVINCSTCGEPIKCQIKIIDRTRNSVQSATVEVDQRDLDLHHMSKGHAGERRVDNV